MQKYVYNLREDELIEIDNFVYKVQEVKGEHKTKRRYESFIFYPPNAGYDKYKIKLIDILTGEKITKIYNADKLFTLMTPTKQNYYVIEINNGAITLFTENYAEVNLKIDTIINFEMYNSKINNFLNEGSEIFITILNELTTLKIIDIKVKTT